MKVRTKRLRVYIRAKKVDLDQEQQKALAELGVEGDPRDLVGYEVVELEGDAAPPSEDLAVFHLREMGLDLSLLAPIGQTKTGEGKRAWSDFVIETARRLVVGWENVDEEETGEPVPFNAELLVDGTIHPDITGNLVFWLYARARKRREALQGNARSGASRKRRRPSGRHGEGPGTAASAKRRDARPA